MIIEICSQERAEKEAAMPDMDIAVISITSTEQEDVKFAPEFPESRILRLKFNDIQSEYDEDGIPYGRPVPKYEDFAGLKKFLDRLDCGRLLIHCWEGESRSAAVAAAVYEYRACVDKMYTYQRFRPIPRVYAQACHELERRKKDLRYTVVSEDGRMLLKKIRNKRW